MVDKSKVIYPEQSYKIIGCLFTVFKSLGGCRKEKVYQDALISEFDHQKIEYQSQLYYPLILNDKQIGKDFFDFLIEDKIILEIKVGSFFKRNNLDQVLEYLKVSGLKLGIIANFTRDGVKSYRVLNIS